MRKLRAYMGYDRYAGPSEGAILIFAYTAREAKKIGWYKIPFDCDSYIDFYVEWLKDRPWIFEQKTKEEPYATDSPITCKECGLWGNKMIGELCLDCQEEMDQLMYEESKNETKI